MFYFIYFFVVLFFYHLYLELVGERKHLGKNTIRIKDHDSYPKSYKKQTYLPLKNTSASLYT